MAKKRKKTDADVADADDTVHDAPDGPLTWEEIRENIGPGGIVAFQVSAEGYSSSSKASRRKWHPRIVAAVLRECGAEADIGDVMADQGYPDGQYILTARTGPGRADWWKPYGATVSFSVAVGEGTLQEVDEESEEEETGTPQNQVEADLMARIRQNDLMRQVRFSEDALDEQQSRTRSRERRDYLDLLGELRESREGRGSNVAELIAALAPVFVPLLERFAKPAPDLGTKAAEGVIGLVTESAKTQASIASSVMREMLQTTMDMFTQMQRDKLGLQEEQDPIKALLPMALQAALPSLAGATGGQGANPSPTAPPGSPVATPHPGAPPPQVPQAASFVRVMLHLTQVRPHPEVIYEQSVRKAFGLLPETDRTLLLTYLQDPNKGAFVAFAEFAVTVDPTCREPLAVIAQDEPAAKYLIDLVALLADDFLGGKEEEEETKAPEEPANVG